MVLPEIVVTLAAAAEECESDGEDTLLEEELLVEDVSIDGMCGVY